MSTRALAVLALLLGAVLALLGVTALQVTGLGGLNGAGADASGWEFRNALLDCKPGTLALIRPGRADEPDQRYWFLRVFREPQQDDLTAADSDVGRYAHVRAAVSLRKPDEEDWYFQSPGFFAYRQMGALGSKQWLSQISLIREKGVDGKQRDLLRATFLNTAHARMSYFYDPAESASEAAQRGFGWVYMIQDAKDYPTQVYHLDAAGFREPPPLATKKQPKKPN